MENTADMIDPHERLANAIILQAVQDYRKAVKRLKKYPYDHAARGTRTSVLHFFRSDWFKMLTNIDGESLIKKLNEEVK